MKKKNTSSLLIILLVIVCHIFTYQISKNEYEIIPLDDNYPTITDKK